MEVPAAFLQMLLAGASRADLELSRLRSREAELSALYETARDLTAIRDVDAILAAIVRRARQLLHADMTYLSLNDEVEGASYMKVTDGALTPEFRRLRLPLGTGLLGLVAQAGAPYFTEDYQADQRFLHQDYIDDAVAGEHIRAILGVPLIVDDTVIGALLAVHRVVRPFPPGEVALLTSFAAHAAVALENARLFEQAQEAVADAAEANRQLQVRSEATERAAHAHDLLTDVLLHGGGIPEVASVLARVLEGQVAVYDELGRVLAGAEDIDASDLGEAIERARSSGRCVQAGESTWVAVAAAGEELLGTLVLSADELDQPERRTLERGALVTALVLLFTRTEADAERRVRGELLADLLSGRELDPGPLRERARRRGADLDGDLVVAVADVDKDPATVRAATTLAQDRRGLGAVHQGHLVLLVPGDVGDVNEVLSTRLPGATIGLAACRSGIDGVAPAWAEARQTMTALQRLGRTGEVSDPAGLGMARLLLGDSGPDELEEFIRRTLGPVLDYDRERDTRLVETLDAWFSSGGRLRETAERLHVHANTVTQRLDRVGNLLGEGWRSPDRRLDVQLALQLDRLRTHM